VIEKIVNNDNTHVHRASVSRISRVCEMIASAYGTAQPQKINWAVLSLVHTVLLYGFLRDSKLIGLQGELKNDSTNSGFVTKESG